MSRRRGYLLDTHTFLWLASDDRRLTGRVREIVLVDGNDLYLSVASIWEMAIKSSIGKLRLQVPLAKLIRSQRSSLATRLLPLHAEHALGVTDLAFHHRDPFDRLLVAQCRAEDLPLLSADRAFDAYGVRRIWE